ncbi:MAG: tyrosine-type recombinase/integrase, partial [Sedimentisphaerales bacterium]|nr:tyrosine-type recombinase/integrase [Sedimentisphaerales bacterium]
MKTSKLFRPTGQQTNYLAFTDFSGIHHRLALLSDKTASESLAEIVKRLVRTKAVGMDDQTARDMQQLPDRISRRLIAWGVVGGQAAGMGKPLAEHLKDYKQGMLDKGNTADYAELTHNRAKTVLVDKCKFTYIADIKASSVANIIAGLRHEKTKIPLSLQSQNFYLKACQQFIHWMVHDRRTSDDPLRHLKGKNVKLDRRHDRRALSADELRRLFEATAAAPFRWGMAGTERVLLYQLAAETGLRANEIRSLKVSSFDLLGHTIALKAGYSKRRREDTITLRPSMVDALVGLLRGKLPTARAFHVPSTSQVVKMLRADLADAKIEYCVDGLYADFHALRHSTGSLLVASGAHPKIVQSIMRHSTIELTMNKYSHIFAGAESDALAKLPDFSVPSEQSQKQVKTGTDGVSAENSLPKICQKSAKSDVNCLTFAYNGLQSTSLQNAEKPVLECNKPHFSDENERRRWESNPRNNGFANR